MGVSETGATSSTYTNDDQYTSTNQPDPQDADTGGGQPSPDSAPTSDPAGSSSTGGAAAEGDESTGGDGTPPSGATNTQTTEDSGGPTSQQNTTPYTAAPQNDDITAGPASAGGSQDPNRPENPPNPKGSNAQQAGGEPTPGSTQNDHGATGSSDSTHVGEQRPATAETISNHNTGTSAPPKSAREARDDHNNASAPVARPTATQGASNGSTQAISTMSKLATPQPANAGAQQPATPGARQSPPPDAPPRKAALLTSSPAGPHGVQQGNGPAGSPPIGTAGVPQARANDPDPSSGETKAPFATGQTVPPNRGGSVAPAESPPPMAAPARKNTPVLNGATQSELTGLLTKYDTENDGQTQDSRNRVNDAVTAGKIQQANELDYTGYPPDVQAFEDRMAASQAQLAALPQAMRDYYTGQLAAMDVTYRNMTSPEARAAVNQNAIQLQNDILAEYNHSINDPLDRTTAIFNHPVGAGYLDEQHQAQLKQLDQLREDFLNAPDAASREAIFKKAETLKTGLQVAAANGVDAYLTKDRAAWEDANHYVDQLVADAGKIQDPSKRYKSIGDGLFSLNTGMGEDDVADRRVLAFTQHLMDDPELRTRLDQWQGEAGLPLNAQGASAAPPYSQIVNNLPAAGPDYVRDLADQYTAVIKGQTKGERDAAFNQAKPYLQAAEGFARFMLGITPLAPLNSALDGASVLSQPARMGIDIASTLAGVATAPFIGGVSAEARAASSFVSDLRTESAIANESAQDLKLGMQEGKLALTTENGDLQAAENAGKAGTAPTQLLEPELQAAAQEGGAAQTGYKPAEIGPSLDPRMLDARARIESNPMAVPSRYAAEVNGNALKPDENAAGVLNDANNQHYIRSGNEYFKVKYDSDNETWRAVNPESPNSFSYPVRYNPQDGTWSLHGDVGIPGGGPLSRLVSLGKYAKGDPRIASLINSKVLKPQDPQTCFLDHGRIAQQAAGVPDGRLRPISMGPLNANQLQTELGKGPIVLSARNIARPDSNYSGMHTVVLLKTIKEDGKNYVLGIDLDDTIGRNGHAQNLETGDFGGVKYDLDQLVKQAAPYVDEDTGTPLEMYLRPQEKKGIWSWFS
ncbi:hypothetical protein [Paraburkholderia sp. J63]|uniref:hypothetical protein n=1 Tax=Paraburkholderia sp. J63 TaxID=2805434 RepID=UPI002ABE3C0B|nr:hypothetical protein [Paraburkholderia sp. J63]